jgi:hypothetical protein
VIAPAFRVFRCVTCTLRDPVVLVPRLFGVDGLFAFCARCGAHWLRRSDEYDEARARENASGTETREAVNTSFGEIDR